MTKLYFKIFMMAKISKNFIHPFKIPSKIKFSSRGKYK